MTENDMGSKVESALKRLVSKRLSSLFDGLLSGFMVGVVITLIAFGQEAGRSLSHNMIIFLSMLATLSVVILARGLYSAITTSEE